MRKRWKVIEFNLKPIKRGKSFCSMGVNSGFGYSVLGWFWWFMIEIKYNNLMTYLLLMGNIPSTSLLEFHHISKSYYIFKFFMEHLIKDVSLSIFRPPTNSNAIITVPPSHSTKGVSKSFNFLIIPTMFSITWKAPLLHSKPSWETLMKHSKSSMKS